jgi:hypothetical protein
MVFIISIELVNLTQSAPPKITYSIAGAASAFSFFSNTWILGCSNTEPLAVAFLIWPSITLGAKEAIAATHIGKLAYASVNFFQTLSFTDTKTIRPSQSSSKDCQPFSMPYTWRGSLILMMGSSFPVVGTGVLAIKG